MTKYDLITIIGPTASGKTKLAAHLAYMLDAEIISGDSRQVYKGMDIGTGKDLNEYVIQEKQIPYYLIDIVNAGEKYNVFQFKRDFFQAYYHIKKRGKVPILCGGSGMYIEAILRNYELVEVPENKALREQLSLLSLEELVQILKQYKSLHNKTDIDNKKRVIRAIEIAEFYKTHSIEEMNYPSLSSITFGIYIPREIRRQRITERLKIRLEQGMIEEVKQLLNQGISPDDLIYYGLEYKYITEYILGKYNYESFFSKLETAIHQFAKRQMTYFRGMERRGVSIIWLDGTKSIQENLEFIINTIKQSSTD
ncbi:MAG: tRNA (adenosine(37)-N6)-dimethylallyltransferase MiaA [Bacteroidales bacterium]|nr:tRNA (adenosine(37)-N6)-dimethylallyltransferase MiaA [Bacteroidales bacterium]